MKLKELFPLALVANVACSPIDDEVLCNAQEFGSYVLNIPMEDGSMDEVHSDLRFVTCEDTETGQPFTFEERESCVAVFGRGVNLGLRAPKEEWCVTGLEQTEGMATGEYFITEPAGMSIVFTQDGVESKDSGPLWFGIARGDKWVQDDEGNLLHGLSEETQGFSAYGN